VRRIGLPGSGISPADCGGGGRRDVWPSLHIARIGGALRKMSSKSEHEPTSVRSRDYGSGHPIRVCPDIGGTFSWLPTSPVNVRRHSCFRPPVGRLRDGQTFKPIGAIWFHRNRKTVSTLFRPTLSRMPQETQGTSEMGCCWYARSCDSGVIERKSPERGPRGKDRYGTITNPNPAGRGARGKAPRSPCIALRPRFGGASFRGPIQIGHDG